MDVKRRFMKVLIISNKSLAAVLRFPSHPGERVLSANLCETVKHPLDDRTTDVKNLDT